MSIAKIGTRKSRSIFYYLISDDEEENDADCFQDVMELKEELDIKDDQESPQ